MMLAVGWPSVPPARRTGYLRRRPAADRKIDALWVVIRSRRTVTPLEAAQQAGVSQSYARHAMRRLAAEGILNLVGAAGHGDGGQLVSAVYEMARDLGPRAPILIGGMRAGAAGITDPNAPPAEPAASSRTPRRVRSTDQPHDQARRLRLKLGLTQAEMGRRLDVSADTVRRWETPPDRKRHEPISPRRLAQIEAML